MTAAAAASTPQYRASPRRRVFHRAVVIGSVAAAAGLAAASVFSAHSVALLSGSSDRPRQNDARQDAPRDGSAAEIAAYVSGSMAVAPPFAGPPALPSVRVEDNDDRLKRGHYGGAGDAAHLGGFTELDEDGIALELWRDMLGHYGIKTLMDLGCGRGVSTAWFLLQGVDARCAEGSHDAVERNMFGEVGIGGQEDRVTEHDFSRGPWWPTGPTCDAVWAVEFLEHVGRNYHRNYFPVLKKAALVFATHSKWGGWHHVEVHDEHWWRNRLEGHGLVFSEELSSRARESQRVGHIKRSMMVFLNPSVLSLPAHSHLFAEPGCFDLKNRPKVDCGVHPRAIKETKLPDEYFPIKFVQEGEDRWCTFINAARKKIVEEEKAKFAAAGKEWDKKKVFLRQYSSFLCHSQ